MPRSVRCNSWRDSFVHDSSSRYLGDVLLRPSRSKISRPSGLSFCNMEMVSAVGNHIQQSHQLSGVDKRQSLIPCKSQRRNIWEVHSEGSDPQVDCGIALLQQTIYRTAGMPVCPRRQTNRCNYEKPCPNEHEQGETTRRYGKDPLPGSPAPEEWGSSHNHNNH